jgi:hypothetical protein
MARRAALPTHSERPTERLGVEERISSLLPGKAVRYTQRTLREKRKVHSLFPYKSITFLHLILDISPVLWVKGTNAHAAHLNGVV